MEKNAAPSKGQIAREAAGAVLWYLMSAARWARRHAARCLRPVAQASVRAARDVVDCYRPRLRAPVPHGLAIVSSAGIIAIVAVALIIQPARSPNPVEAAPAQPATPSEVEDPVSQPAEHTTDPVSLGGTHPAEPQEPAEADLLVPAVEPMSDSAGVHDFLWVPSSLSRAAEHAVALWERRYADRWPNCNISPEFLIATAHLESRPWWGDIDNRSGDMNPPLSNAFGAHGAFQFIDAAWAEFGHDANGDGRKDPQNVYDAAAASMKFQCHLAEAYPNGLDDRMTALDVATDYHDGPARSRSQTEKCRQGIDIDTRRCAGEVYAAARVVIADRLHIESHLEAAGVSEGTADTATTGECTVAIIGDSLTVGAAPFTAGEFEARGLPAPMIDAEVGRSLREASSRHEQLVNSGTTPDVLIVALGTNDGYRSRVDVRSNVDAMPDSTVWIAVNEPAGWVNGYLPNPIIDPSFERFTADDGIHLTAAGYRSRAALYAGIAESTCPDPATEILLIR